MNKINLLSKDTIQKIAAGEIIDRPASVIKEIIENSLDASSSSIVIETLDGGKKTMKISDDGFGINREDIELAFTPHATSKLSDISDLYRISSYGFRGEALASISSVSKIEIITRTINDKVGIRALVENNKIISKEEIAAPVGTSIKIDNLFYNIPVRQNLLKSKNSENNAIYDVVLRQALSTPTVKMKYFKEGQNVFSVNATNSIEERIFLLLGKEFSNGLKYFNTSVGSMEIFGGVSSTELYRGTRSHQILFINNRSVFIPAISKAIDNYYRTIIPNGKFPCYVIYINIPSNELDINVHPNKKEVKLLNSDFIIQNLIGAIKNNTDKINIVKKANLFKNESFDSIDNEPLVFSNQEDVIFKDYTKNVETNLTLNKVLDYDKTNSIYNKSLDSNKKNLNTNLINISEFEKQEVQNLDNTFSIKDTDLFSEPIEINENIKTFNNFDNVIDNETNLNLVLEEAFEYSTSSKNHDIPIDYKVIGVLFKTYIIIEDTNNKAFIIDQHAAHERIMYEKYKYEFKENKVEIQRTITPEILNLSKKDKDMVLKYLDKLLSFGFEIEDFGGNDIAIRGVPMIFNIETNKQFLLNILDSLYEINHPSEFLPEKIMKKACTNAIKAGDEINEVSIIDLINQLKECENPKTCPHGRPTIMELSKSDFEKAFLRI